MSNARNMARLMANQSGVILKSSMPDIPGSVVTGTINSNLLPSGSTLQVKSTLFTSINTVTLDLGYWSNVPSVNVSINPLRSNSKFRIDIRWGGEMASAWDVVFAISRNGTIIGLPTQEGTRMGAVGMALQTYIDDNNDSTPEYTCFSYIDTPNTLAPITYTLVAKAWSARTLFTGSTVNQTDGLTYERISSEIIVTEIAQ